MSPSRRLLRLLLPALLLALLPAPAPAAPEPAGSRMEELEVGAPAPALSLEDLSGKRFDLASVLGKNAVVVSFWSIYCDSCVKEMVSLQKLEDKYRGQGLTLVAVNEDQRIPGERILRFMDRLQRFRSRITYPVLLDREGAAFAAFRGNFLPTTILIDRQGKVWATRLGFDAEAEADLLGDIEAMVAGKPAATASAPGPRLETVTVTASAPLFGFHDKGGWVRSFSGDRDRDKALASARASASHRAEHQAFAAALRALGIALHSTPPPVDRVDEAGIHLEQEQVESRDPLGRLHREVKVGRFLDLAEEQEKVLGEAVTLARTYRVDLDALEGELEAMGFTPRPQRINFTYVNMTPLDQKEFIAALLAQSLFVGKVESPVFTPHSTSQAFEIYTSPQGFAQEMGKMDFGRLKVFVEEVTPSSLELEVWK